MSITLNNRQKLVFEACQKIKDGERLIAEGKIELDHLVREDSPGTPQERSTFRVETRTDDELRDKIQRLRAKNMSVHKIRNKLNVSPRHMKRLMSSEGTKTKIRDVKTRRSAAKLAGRFLDLEHYVDVVAKFIKSNEWVHIKKMRSELGISWGALQRVLTEISARGLARTVVRANNPAHANDLRTFNKKLTYWEAN